MDYQKNDLRLELKTKIREFVDLTEDKHCDGCSFLTVEPPYKGITTADINVWRDSYKIKCDQFNMMWTNGKREHIPRCLECLVTDSKYSI